MSLDLVLLEPVRSAEPPMVSSMIGLIAPSTISDDLRVATDLAASDAAFLRAFIVADSFLGASPA